eukprot:scaffold27330_cov146-Isochrysis_galbana.AAC.4
MKTARLLPGLARAPAPSAGPPYVIHASIREPLARTRATPTPSTSRGSTSCSCCRKMGISSFLQHRPHASASGRAGTCALASLGSPRA